MYRIRFFQDGRGRRPIVDYIKKLTKKKNKDSCVKLSKINDYIEALQKGGTQIGEPYVKHLDGEIWELRPLRDRFLFAVWDAQSFILLHRFVKKTKKTPLREIEQAKRELADRKERSANNE